MAWVPEMRDSRMLATSEAAGARELASVADRRTEGSTYQASPWRTRAPQRERRHAEGAPSLVFSPRPLRASTYDGSAERGGNVAQHGG